MTGSCVRHRTAVMLTSAVAFTYGRACPASHPVLGQPPPPEKLTALRTCMQPTCMYGAHTTELAAVRGRAFQMIVRSQDLRESAS
mmetsp:Transcript_42052/g.84433  ORF Transcript_42052/g.84433 Transcript_42052/m.84433 type:complete len:85 (-) Transcript_42052:1611-1865(-)